MEDEKIIELYNMRSEAAIAQTAEKYGRYAQKIAFNVLGNLQDCEECVSDAYMKLWGSIPPQRPKSLKAFFGRVVRNLALDRIDYENAEKRGGGAVVLCLDELSECIPDKEMPDEGITEIINGYLKTQSKEKAFMFVRRYWYLDSIREIAFECACSESKVKTTLMRMRGELKDALVKEGIEI